MAARGGQIRLRGRLPHAMQDVDQRRTEVTRERARLIEPALTLARSVQRHRNDAINPFENVCAGGAELHRERTRQRRTSVVLERVYDGAQRSLVRAKRARA